MSNAVAGVGTLFRRWSGTAWVDLAEINSISGPSITRDTYEVTSLDSTDGYREYKGGFRDGNNVQLTMNFTRSTYDTMKTDFEDDDAQSYEIVFPDTENTSFEFSAFVMEISLEIVTDDKITSTVNLKVTGPVTVDSGSGS